MREFPVTEDALLPVGTTITAMHFVPGQFVDVQSTTKGKGFEGIIFTKGPCNSRPVFQTLQALSGGPEIGWNFKGLYVVSKTGEVSEVKDGMDVEELVKAKLAE